MGVAGKTLVVGGAVAIAIVARAAFPTDGLTPYARQEIPGHLVAVYKDAARTCAGLPWQVLAAIGWAESRHGGGAIDPDTGDTTAPILGDPLDGAHGELAQRDPAHADGWARPLGPMGLLPSAWQQWATLAPGRPAGATPSVHNAWDAAYATAGELCGGAPAVNDVNRAVRAHTPRPDHVMAVLLKSGRYGYGEVPDIEALVLAAAGPADDGAGGPSGAATAIVSAALRMIGTPYVWGAESPADGFDCSGLVWWAYRQAGVGVARTTEGQIDLGVEVTPGQRLQPGDLLFTRGGRPVRDKGHVAIYAGNGLEVVAPSSGKSVTVQRVDPDRVQAVRRILA